MPDPQTLLERMILALLPLRVFLGATFVYAGMDKLIDPAFLQASGPGSIGSQLDAFIRVSPIAPLIQIFGQTFPVQIGFLIALAEIAVGLGALSGLLFRFAAAGGFALSILFWLTASWVTKPYYYGPDLPYAFGWLTLALAGTGGRFTVETWLDRLAADDPYDEPTSTERRFVLRAGVLGFAAIALAGLAGTIGASAFGGSRSRATADASRSPATLPTSDTAGRGIAPTTDPTAAPSTRGSASATAPPPGVVVATVSQLASGRAVTFDDPTTGDPGILVKLGDGSIVAFDAICTHAGCIVGYDRRSGLLLCPCHGAAFDPRNHAQVVGGPTDQPLAPIPIHVDSATGRITIKA